MRASRRGFRLRADLARAVIGLGHLVFEPEKGPQQVDAGPTAATSTLPDGRMPEPFLDMQCLDRPLWNLRPYRWGTMMRVSRIPRLPGCQVVYAAVR